MLRSFAHRVQRGMERRLLPMGNRVECPYCHWTGFRFMSAGARMVPNRLCPSCGSLERYRMLPLLLERELGGRDASVLELAPKRCFGDFSRHQGWTYVSSDLMSPGAMVRGDLRQMPFADGAFDVIVIFHVMEHIIEDVTAYGEVARMLAPDGFAVICVPLSGQRTQEGAPKSEWTRLYGQDDHVRLYGFDIEDRMRSGGLDVTRIDTHAYFTPQEADRYALRGDDRYLFLARKAAS